ncbi:FkbM family methyltransferase [Owenweeksia hongkongensis]|uniref:FkbM family methyltransferase n=1 Tax=Owenweeksia hongkongensis TaxID=253245 RepID=UPI003A9233FC
MFSSIYSTFVDRGPSHLLHAIVSLSVGMFQSFVLGNRFVKRRIYDYHLWLDMKDRGISRTLLLFGERELEHKIMLERILKPGMKVFDVGANIGYYAIMESKLVGDNGSILAVEPSPSNVALLKRNLELNGVVNTIVREGAVSDKAETKKFYLAHQSNLNTFHDTGSGLEHLSGKTIDVQTFTVPDLAREYGVPDLLRMDVEGHEVQVLAGMVGAIRDKKIRPIVIFETHLSRYSAENDFRPVLEALFEQGYSVSLAASSWEAGSEKVKKFGYSSSGSIRSDGVEREFFENISNQDALEIICNCGGLRTVVLSAS